MPCLDESEFKKKIKQNPIGVYLIYGSENYLKKVYCDKLVSASVSEDFASFNLHTFEGGNTEFSEIYDIVQSVPMMSESTCVLVRDMPLDLGDEDAETLERILIETPEYCTLIFLMLTVKNSGANWNKVVKLFDKYGFSVRLDSMQSGGLQKTLESGAVKRGTPFASGVASYLMNCAGNEMTVLINELDKLSSFCTGREITKKDVDLLCIKTVEATAFEMIKALSGGRFDEALKKLDNLFYLRTEPNLITGALISSYTDIYRAKCAVKAGKNAVEVGKYYDYKNKEFRLNNASRASSAFSFSALSECMEILSDADKALKTTAADGRLILEKTLVRLALTEGNKKK